MKLRLILIVFFLLGVSGCLFGQTTAVSGKVADSTGQTYNYGTWEARLIGPAGYGGPFFYNGMQLGPTNILKDGVLDSGGNISVTVYSNNVIRTQGSSQILTLWQFTVCPASASNCYTTALNITGASYSVTGNIVSPPITVTATPNNHAAAYSDTEIVGAAVGYTYFNLTDQQLRVCESPACTWTAVGGGGSGTVQPTPQYSLFMQPNSGSQAVAGPSDIATDNTKSDLFVPGFLAVKGPAPWADISEYGARALSSPVTGTANCNGTTTITLSSAYALLSGDGIIVYGCGPTNTLATPAAPTVTTGASGGATTPDVPIYAASGGASSYSYKVIERDNATGLSIPSTVTTITTGPTALGQQTCAVTSAALSNYTLTLTTTTSCAIPVHALISYRGGTALQSRGVVATSSGTSVTMHVAQNSAMQNVNSSTGGTIYWFWGNQIAFTPVANSFGGYICAERPGDGSYHIIGVLPPGTTTAGSISATFDDWGATISAAPILQPNVSDASCNNTSAINDALSTTIVSGAGTTTLTVANAASQTVSGASIYQDNWPAIQAAGEVAAANHSSIYIPATTQQFYVFYPGTLSNTGIWESGSLTLKDTVTFSGNWDGLTNAGSLAQFSWKFNPTVYCYAVPCLYLPVNGTTLRNMNFGYSGNGAIVLDATGGQQTYSYLGLSTGTSADYDGIGLLILGGDYQYHLDHLVADGGQQENVDATTAPSFFFDGNGLTGGPPDSVTGNSINTNGRSIAIQGDGGSSLYYTFQDVYNQGGIFPAVSFQNFANNESLTASLTGTEQDTSNESCVAVFNGTGSMSGMIALNGCLTTGTAVAGSNFAAYQNTASFVNNSSYVPASNQEETGTAPTYANDYYDFHTVPFLRSFRRSAGPLIALSGAFTPLAAPVLNAPTLSSGGSVPVGSHTYEVWAVGYDGGWGKASAPQTIVTTTGNQTVTLNWNAVLGAAGYYLIRDDDGFSPSGNFWGPFVTGTSYVDALATPTGLDNVQIPLISGDATCGFSSVTQSLVCPKWIIPSSDSASFEADFSGNFTASHHWTLPDIDGVPAIINGSMTDTDCVEGRNVSGQLYLQDAGARCGSGGGSGTVTSVGITGTANQIAVSGTCTITTTGVCNLAFPSTIVIPDGSTATTQTTGDNTTKLATDAFVLANVGSGNLSMAASPTPLAEGIPVITDSTHVHQSANCTPPASNGVYWMVYVVTASAAVDPSCPVVTGGVNAVSTNTTLTAANGNQLIDVTSAATITLPATIPSSPNNSFAVAVKRDTSGAVSIAPNGVTFEVCGTSSTSSFAIPVQGEAVTIGTDGTNYIVRDCPFSPGTNVTMSAPGSGGLAINATGGGASVWPPSAVNGAFTPAAGSISSGTNVTYGGCPSGASAYISSGVTAIAGATGIALSAPATLYGSCVGGGYQNLFNTAAYTISGGYTVVHNTGCTFATTTSFACTIPATAAGNTLIFMQQSGFESGQTFSCADNGSDTYTTVAYANSADAGNCYSISVASGVTQVTMTLGVANIGQVRVLEVSGITSIDKTSSAGTFATSFSVGPTSTLSNSADWSVGVLASSSGIITLTPSGQFASGTSLFADSTNSGGTSLSGMDLTVASNAAITFSGTSTNVPSSGMVLVFH